MIFFRWKNHTQHQEMPPELVGFRDLSGSDLAVCHSFREDGHIAGICDPILWRPPSVDAAWVEGPEGWDVVATDGAPDGGSFMRGDAWCKVILVQDAKGRFWGAPSLLTATGVRAFSVAYAGKSFLPQPTPQQDEALALATEARTVLQSAASGGAPMTTEQLMPWAAYLLTLTTHISVDTVAQCGLLDELLAQRIVAASAGLYDSNEDRS